MIDIIFGVSIVLITFNIYFMAKSIVKLNAFIKLQSKLNVEIGEAISAINKVTSLNSIAVKRLLFNNSKGSKK
jgi:hypothetical protein